jgi:hypothetical protein
LLYYLCTKKDPFEGGNPSEIKRNILNGKIERISSKIDPIIKILIDQCLIQEEKVRPSAIQLIEFLNEIEEKYYGLGLADSSSDEEDKPLYGMKPLPV